MGNGEALAAFLERLQALTDDERRRFAERRRDVDRRWGGTIQADLMRAPAVIEAYREIGQSSRQAMYGEALTKVASAHLMNRLWDKLESLEPDVEATDDPETMELIEVSSLAHDAIEDAIRALVVRDRLPSEAFRRLAEPCLSLIEESEGG